MPHLVILYTEGVEPEADLPTLCKKLADAMARSLDENSQPVFPIGGIRVLAHQADHAAIADGSEAFGFIYFNLRMAKGRPDAVVRNVGERLKSVIQGHLAPLLSRRLVGVTLQIDEGLERYDAKIGNLHEHFRRQLEEN